MKTVFTCQNCGYQSPKWLGKCPECAKWNSLVEEEFKDALTQQESLLSSMISSAPPQKLSDIKTEDILRATTNIGELDRVLGGGLVKGSVVLVGGEPGIGKSTLMLQVSEAISKDKRVLYVSGEESVSQTKLRAQRLGIISSNLYLVNESNLNKIIEYIKELKPYLVVIDSIQIVYKPEFTQGAGTITQIRECTADLTMLAKSLGISVFVIGHITKEGFIAGPKALEHIVDSVIYFEGERHSAYRILRAVKNRFGAVDEVGIFSMGSKGLEQVEDPSKMFVLHKGESIPGTAATPTIEGTRPLIVEVQALASAANFGMSKQRSMGFDFNRLALLLAVIEKYIGLGLSSYDIFLNIAGGVRVVETAPDLAACIAIISSFRNKPVRHDTVIMGEVGLTSEVRKLTHMQARINEARRMGFKRCVIPKGNLDSVEKPDGIELIGVANLQEAIECAFVEEVRVR